MTCRATTSAAMAPRGPAAIHTPMNAVAGVAVVAAALGGCSPGNTSASTHRESLASVQINDQPAAVPATRLVMCRRAAGQESVFFWSGSNVLMPRRPMEERRSDSVEVHFDDDPLTVTAASLHFLHGGQQLSARWSQASSAEESVALTSTGPGQYLLTATVHPPAPPSARPLLVRIIFDC